MHRLIISILLLCCCLTSCYNEDNSFGETLVNSVFRNVYVDTCSVVVTTSKIDSLETNGKGVALIGNYTHSIWGRVSAEAYIPYETPSYGTDIDETVVLDSLVLVLKYNGYALGDTNTYQTYNIHKLTEKIVLNDNSYLYNSSSFAYAQQPVATVRFRPRTKYEIEVRLPDEIGNDLLSRLHQRDVMMSSDRFDEYFKGFAIVPDYAQCSSLLSFAVGDTASAMIIRYHIKGEANNGQECVITPNTEKEFYNISHDRGSTELKDYDLRNVEIPSESISNRGFLFGGLGWFTRLKFPYLNNILDHGKKVSIEMAYLKIYPELGTYSDLNPLPDSIYLYITDENNIVMDAVQDYLGEEVQSGVLIKDATSPENTYYTFDVTDFMQQELGAFGMYKHNLQLVFAEDDYTKTFRNLTISDKNGHHPISLNLTYKIYESY